MLKLKPQGGPKSTRYANRIPDALGANLRRLAEANTAPRRPHHHRWRERQGANTPKAIAWGLPYLK